ncbi:hypothetical protein FHS96_003061 [Sphingomonas zeicaulis]|uniref:hypothetical protein n=1 Tax=Sphingomonas zeicaulis TaxID=1632740 RepID=UPI003D209B0E
MSDLRFNYSLVDHGSHIALHEVGFRGSQAVAVRAEPVTFTATHDRRRDLVAEISLAHACANDLPIIPAAGLLVIATAKEA